MLPVRVDDPATSAPEKFPAAAVVAPETVNAPVIIDDAAVSA